MIKDDALKMAIKKIEGWIDHAYGHSPEECADNKTIMACKEALEQPEPRLFLDLSHSHGNHPVNKEWQGLTDDEIDKVYYKTFDTWSSEVDVDYARAIEQALKEKNNG
jgi:hypothetical protein